MLKKLIFFLSAVLLFLFAAPLAHANEITIVNPIRGNDFWSHNFGILDTPQKQYELISQKNLSATWLIRYDALKDEKVVEFLKSLNSQQEVGIFFEVTPTLTQDSGVNYNQSQNWHFAKSVLLTGYPSDDRVKMMDTAVKRFREVFGKNPKSVGAWWIDASSLNYLQEKYGVVTNLDVADQFSTDGYQVWGQYWSIPFYPSKVNALMPSQSEDQKSGIVTIQWAHRDPFNGYGNGVFESTYSVQANDYILHDLKTDYFAKLLEIYPQVTVGLENDFDWKEFGQEYTNQINLIKHRVDVRQSQSFTMEGFGDLYKQLNPTISPDVLIYADDPLGTDGKVVWYQTPKYRVGWFYGPYGSVIRDLREFNDSRDEDCLKKACDTLKLAFTATSAIDEVNYGTKWVIDEGKISETKVNVQNDEVTITYKNQANLQRTIKFLNNDIKIDDDIKPISTFVLRAVESSQNSSQIKNQDEKDFISYIKWDEYLPKAFLDWVKFLILTVFFFLIPGWVLTRRILYAIPVGWVIFTLSGFILGYLNLLILIWLIPIISIAGIFKLGLPKLKLKWQKEFTLLTPLVIIGSLSLIVTQFKNGISSNYGFGYWGPNGHDAIWHLSLISELSKNVPPQNPVFAGETLRNYHYFFDLLVACASTLFVIDPQELLFRLFPLSISVLTGLIMYFTVKRILVDRGLSEKVSIKSALLATFFLYFGGSFGWIVSYLRNRDFGGETTFWAQQSISTLLNPPFAISITLFLTGLYFYHLFRTSSHRKIELKLRFWKGENDNLKNLIIIALVWGTLIEFKAYGGVLVLLTLGIITIERLFSKDFKFLYLTITTGIVAAIVFLPNNIGSNSLLEFKPLWLVDSMISIEDRLFIPRLHLTMQSGVFYKVIPAFVLASILFLIGNFGTRAFALLNPKTIWEHRFLGIFTILGIVLPLLFIQKGNNWNIVQFMYYSLMVLGIFASITIAKLSDKFGKWGIAGIVIIILLTIPTSFNTGSQYIPKRPPAKLSTSEIEALNILKQQPQGTVLSLNYDEKIARQFSAPKPLAYYTSTSYVSAFSSHPSFLEDTINLEILGIDFKGRLNSIREFGKGTDKARQILKDNNISYVYLLKKQNVPVDEGRMGLKKIFGNDEALVFKVE
jgi:hypothetical protein